MSRHPRISDAELKRRLETLRLAGGKHVITWPAGARIGECTIEPYCGQDFRPQHPKERHTDAKKRMYDRTCDMLAAHMKSMGYTNFTASVRPDGCVIWQAIGSGRGRSRKARAEWFKRRAAADPAFRLNRNMRNHVHQALRGKKNGVSWRQLTGYSIEELQRHLEARFAEGMSWDNYGQWHVDHIKPLSAHAITGPGCPEFKAAWSLENLQPLWAADNIRKGARWEP